MSWDEQRFLEKQAQVQARKESPENVQQKKETGQMAARRVTFIQIAACLLVALAAGGLRLVGGPVYETVRDWYQETVHQSLIAGESWEEAMESVGAQLVSRLNGG